MNEKAALELLNYVRSYSDGSDSIQVSLNQCGRAIAWAKQAQNWSLVMELAYALSDHFASLAITEDENTETSDITRNLWEQGRTFAVEGLLVAKQLENQEQELKFLVKLSELSGYLNDFDAALDYLKQELRLVRPDMKWRSGRAVFLLGRQANSLENFLAARSCYQTSLDIYQKLDKKDAMAEVLAFMAANELTRLEKRAKKREELDKELLAIIDLLWKLRDTLLQEHNQIRVGDKDKLHSSSVDKSAEPPITPTYKRLQNALVKLNSLT